jgi:His/Glu/Gln/Arg/opine family amino acid ABC transporter permease subunit
LPSLLSAAAMTLVLSCLSMALAVCLGAVIATGRVYGNRLLRVLFTAYVEVTRGTPILLQLFVLYFGIAPIIRLPAIVAAIVGLAMNYAAYEAEVYRAGLIAVPGGQSEAARALGLTSFQTLRLVVVPQAFRVALPPMANDFIALLKDTSIVSVITVVELTKQYSITAHDLGSWLVPGALCAGLYFAMSYPLTLVAQRLERKFGAAPPT